MFNWLGIAALNPALLWGGLLVASPIIIHLLNKRNYKIVDWAAMDFLLDADRQNRRRVKLENLLLLLLRCLAVLLIAFLVSRLFLKPTGVAAAAMKVSRCERIMLLDDSPSMGARGDQKTLLEESKENLISFIRFSAEERPGDTLTLLTTSNADRPLINGQYMTADKVETYIHLIKGIEVSDQTAHLAGALTAVEGQLDSKDGNLNRVLYLFSDMRRHDWAGKDKLTKEKKGVPGVLQRLRKNLDGLFVVDVGDGGGENLSVVSVIPIDKTVVAGVPTRFEVTVQNYGETDAVDVEVSFTAGGGMPLRSKLGLIRAGQKASEPFTFTFREVGQTAVFAEIEADALPHDNLRHYAAKVREGVKMLLVDGEPSAEYGQAETFFLERALFPPGDLRSGNSVQVITESQFEGQDLDSFQAIFLCNLYRVSDSRKETLLEWVKAGGGLVYFLGDQVDEVSYNGTLFEGEDGLMPLSLNSVMGDEREREWVNLSLDAVNHPILEIFQGSKNLFIERFKIFRWWNGTIPSEALSSGHTRIIASYTDTEHSPAIVEMTVGEGRVVVLTTPADGEWNNWPADPSYVVTVLKVGLYLARSEAHHGDLPVGLPLRLKIDPARHESTARIQPPGEEEAVALQAIPTKDGRGLVFEFDETQKRGLYKMQLTGRDGEDEEALFAVNIEPHEGDLRRVEEDELRPAFGEADIEIVRGRSFFSKGPTGSKTEFWRVILVVLMGVLCLEQFLGWWFARKM